MSCGRLPTVDAQVSAKNVVQREQNDEAPPYRQLAERDCNRIGKEGTFFQPTVLTDLSRDMTVAQEETFGPLAPIIRFEDAD
ncbi:hypothetical protein BQ8482_130097 [Mesorhizobium delmotii]|uniref:Aldehyde dehydrogenase domain-containing protein n=1 Tax=Mesorhizobium delmotii TaxID=1631247 RepID=A0A2P9AGE5_9HYPH|nr:hypothetical protein BQ8482_130097 [Mesorhizobium delmotii]